MKEGDWDSREKLWQELTFSKNNMGCLRISLLERGLSGRAGGSQCLLVQEEADRGENDRGRSIIKVIYI